MRTFLPAHGNSLEAVASGNRTDEIEFRVFSDGVAKYEYYEDDGDGYGYEKGEYKVTLLERSVLKQSGSSQLS